jgi:hypothetical protein
VTAFNTKLERRRLLRQRGLIPPAPVQVAKTEHDKRKTPAMLLIEDLYGKPIQVLLYEGTLQELADRWHLDESTVCKWRAKFDDL